MKLIWNSYFEIFSTVPAWFARWARSWDLLERLRSWNTGTRAGNLGDCLWLLLFSKKKTLKWTVSSANIISILDLHYGSRTGKRLYRCWTGTDLRCRSVCCLRTGKLQQRWVLQLQSRCEGGRFGSGRIRGCNSLLFGIEWWRWTGDQMETI